jgi:hypothetical protein
MPFPEVDPDANEEYINELAKKYSNDIMSFNPAAVLCQGEMCLAFAVANFLISKGIPVLAACSKRVVTESTDTNGNTIKKSEFLFVRFRQFSKVLSEQNFNRYINRGGDKAHD